MTGSMPRLLRRLVSMSISTTLVRNLRATVADVGGVAGA